MSDTSKLPQVHFSDTTLRDGEQMVGATLRPEQKLSIARALAEAGVNSIEAGFPASGPSEVEAVRLISSDLHGPVVMALCRALPADIDAARLAFENANPFRSSVNIFLATSKLHREVKLGKSKGEILKMVASAIGYARKWFRLVSFSPEDASRTELDFLCEVYRESIDAGATSISFPDTVGILTPEKVRIFIREILNRVTNIERVPLASHFHNDLGLATANTLAAIEEGARVAQCTVNGLGERAGNAALEEVALTMSLHAEQYRFRHTIKLECLVPLSRLIAHETGIAVSANKAIVGANVFSTEAGVHQDGMLKHPDTYQPFPPALVGGDEVRLVIGKHSGRAAIDARLRQMGYTITPELLDRVAAQIVTTMTAKGTDDDALLRKAVAQATQRRAADAVPSTRRENMPVHYSAEAYDRFTHAFLGRFDDLLVRRLLQESRAGSDRRRLLDAGCGTARFLLRLASMPEFAALHFTGLDFFADMVKVSRDNIRLARLEERISLVHGDVHQLPFESASFDLIVSRSTLHHLADPAAALVEMRRVLRPGGVALIHEIRRDADPAAIKMFNCFRERAGVEPTRTEEKFSLDEIRKFVESARLGDEATLIAPMQGYASLGCEVRIAAAG